MCHNVDANTQKTGMKAIHIELFHNIKTDICCKYGSSCDEWCISSYDIHDGKGTNIPLLQGYVGTQYVSYNSFEIISNILRNVYGTICQNLQSLIGSYE